jgi:ABC-2 type transport system permease protein
MTAGTATRPTAGRTATAAGSLVGTAALLRLALRRDRVLLPVWLLVLVASAAGSVGPTRALYPTVASRVQAAEVINATPALVALYGRIHDTSSLGAIALLKVGGLGGVVVAALAFLLVTRHSRTEEEAGRLELVAAGGVGRSAPLAAAVAVSAGTVVATSLATAAALVGTGLPASGSVAFGLAWAGCGLVFVGVGACTAQLAQTGRGANALAGIVLAVAFGLRAIGDSAGPDGASWLSWLSPVGWAQQVRAFAGEQWWVLLLLLGAALVLTTVGFGLAGRRDLGSGALPVRPGRPAAPGWLAGPLALAWRLQRATLLGWTAAFAVLGVVVGSVASSVRSLLDSAQTQDLFTRLGGRQNLVDAFLAAELGIAGILAAVFVVQALTRMRVEETSGRLEAVLATAASRRRWLAGNVVVALGGSVVLLLVTGLAAGLVHAAQDRTANAGDVVTAALVQLPAVWVVAGIVVAGFGLVPRFAALGWVALGAFVLLGELGPVVGLDQRVLDLSPFAHVPRLPGSSAAAPALGWLTLVALGLVVVGLWAFQDRDVAP